MPRIPDTKDEVYDWLAEIEKGCGVSQTVGDSDTCETGDHYVEVLWSDSGFIVGYPDGVIEKVHREKTPESAWSKWVEAFLLYQRPRGGKIHWRIRPEMTHVYEDVYSEDEKGYCVYSRLFAEKV